MSYSIYARANALRIIKFLHSLEDATITTLTNHTDTCTHNMHITLIAIHSTVQRQSTIYHQAIMDSEAVFVDDCDSEGDDANPDSEAEMLSEREEDPNSIQNEASSSTGTLSTATSKAPAKKRSKKRALMKAEKKRLLQRIRGVSTVLLWQEISCRINESILSDFEPAPEKDGDSSKQPESAPSSDDHKLVMQVLSFPTTESLEDIVLHLRDTFVKVYSSCEGQQQKEKYCAFQLEWHKYCSAFLLDKSLLLDTIGLVESRNRDLAKQRARWIQFCESVSVTQEACNRVMMVICAAVYDTLLRHVSKFIKEEILGEQSTSNQIFHQDSDDVLYRFCGAALASMLHARYKHIQTCPIDKKDITSQEITLLQSINSKNKTHIPDYLRYRDRGFMYFPTESFLPFLQAVDTCVRKYTNSTSYQRHGSQIVEVYCIHIYTPLNLIIPPPY